MAKFLVRATYSAEGFKGVVNDKASGRKVALEKALASVGAKLEAMYFTFGDYDLVTIVDAPDNATVMAVGVSACSTGLAEPVRPRCLRLRKPTMPSRRAFSIVARAGSRKKCGIIPAVFSHLHLLLITPAHPPVALIECLRARGW